MRNYRLLCLLLVIFSLVGCFKNGEHETPASQVRFDDIDVWVRIFEDPERAEWQRPDEVVAAMALSEGDVVVDIGAGTGYFTRRFARVVGSSGLAIGLDIEDSMVRHMNREALKLGLDNYVARTIPTDNPGLDSGSVDVVFLCNTYHHITNREEYFRRVAKSLKKDGRLVIVDFYKRELPVGPPPDHKMAKETVIPEIHSAGFELVKSHDLLEYQYFLEFKVQ